MLRPGNTASSTIENSAHWRRHYRKPLRQKVTLRMAIRCPMVRSLAVLPQENRLRVLALFSLAPGRRKGAEHAVEGGIADAEPVLPADEMVAQMVLLDPAAIYENDDRAKEPRVIRVSP